MKHILNHSEYSSRFKWKNDGFRSLYESAIYPEIIDCLEDLKKYDNSNNVLIGGLALSYYLKPRETQDIDLIFLTESDIPIFIPGFKKTRAHGFLHLKTQVEVELFLSINKETVQEVFINKRFIDGVYVASPVSLIALKLNRFNKKDILDIEELIIYCKENKIKIDIENYHLTNKQLNNYNSLNISEELNENMYCLESNFSLNNYKYKIIYSNNFDIYVFNEKFGEPRFHVFNKDKSIRYSLELYTNEIVDSSTDYKSFLMNEELGRDVLSYLSKNKNIIINTWKELNE